MTSRKPLVYINGVETQLGTGDTLDITTGNFSATDHGLLINRLTTTQRDAISSPTTSELIWNSTTAQYESYNGSSWVAIGGGGGETNTASNAGTGTGLFKAKVNADLQFNSLSSSAGTITFANDGNGNINLEHSASVAQTFTNKSIDGNNNAITNILSSALANNVITVAIPFKIETLSAPITTGSKGYIEVPFAMTVTGWTLVADTTGSIVIDVKRSTYSGFPTTSSIAGSDKPTLTSAQKNHNLTLTSWTTSIAAGDVLEFNVDSVATVSKVTLVIRGVRT